MTARDNTTKGAGDKPKATATQPATAEDASAEASTPSQEKDTAPAEQETPAKAKREKRLVKYMGVADRVTLPKGHDFNGQLGGSGLENNVFFSAENKFVVDVKGLGLSDESIDLILADTDRFRDVTGLKRIPKNINQRMFGGAPNNS